MNIKPLFVLYAVLMTICSVAQKKEFSFTQFQIRNSAQQWEKPFRITPRTVRFSANDIDLKIDKQYHLHIVSTTYLPDNGVIYLCKDEKQKNVTVMLIADSKMFLYSDSKRFQIDFDQPVAITARENYYADAD